MATRIQARRGLATNRPVLAEGEFGLDQDTGTLWIGTIINGTPTNKALNSSVTSVNGKSGIVVLVPSDFSLDQVDNTHDAVKNVLTATKLATARNINGVAFDGSAAISIKAPSILQCFGGVSIGNGLTRYIQFGFPTATTSVGDFKFFPQAGNLARLIASGGGGNATTFSVTIEKNGSDTALLLSGLTTPGGTGWGSAVADNVDTVSFNGTSDYMCIKVVNSGSNPLAYVSIYAEYTPTN